MDIPLIISVDDHVVEPPDLWTERIPAKFKDRAPRVELRELLSAANQRSRRRSASSKPLGAIPGVPELSMGSSAAGLAGRL